jgi:hypothetical protein
MGIGGRVSTTGVLLERGFGMGVGWIWMVEGWGKKREGGEPLSFWEREMAKAEEGIVGEVIWTGTVDLSGNGYSKGFRSVGKGVPTISDGEWKGMCERTSICRSSSMEDI